MLYGFFSASEFPECAIGPLHKLLLPRHPELADTSSPQDSDVTVERHPTICSPIPWDEDPPLKCTTVLGKPERRFGLNVQSLSTQ